MKFTAKKNDVLDALKKVTTCVGRNTVLPILANALFEADAETGKVSVTCNNLEQRITTLFDAEIERGGKTTIPAKRLQAVLAAMPATAPVVLDTNEKTFHTAVQCGSAKVTLLGLSPVDFPELDIVKAETRFTLEYKELLRLIKHAGYAISLKDSRKVLHGMLLELNGNQITAVSTDSKRLAAAFCACSDEFPERKQYIIPAATLGILQGLQAEKVEIVFSPKIALFKTESVYLTSKLCEGQFPNYQAVVPQCFDFTAQIDSKILLEKLGLIQQVDAEYIQFAITDENLTIKAESASNGTAIDCMDIVPGGAAIEPQQINLNPAFVGGAVSACADEKEVAFRFNKAHAPVKFEFADGSFAVVMPLAIPAKAEEKPEGKK